MIKSTSFRTHIYVVEPIRLVRYELKKRVIVLMPCCNGRKESFELKKFAHKSQKINTTLLPLCQFATPLKDAHGVIHKPVS